MLKTCNLSRLHLKVADILRLLRRTRKLLAGGSRRGDCDRIRQECADVMCEEVMLTRTAPTLQNAICQRRVVGERNSAPWIVGCSIPIGFRRPATSAIVPPGMHILLVLVIG